MKEDNQAVIKALNMYGRVPEMWELLEEIERLQKVVNDLSVSNDAYLFTGKDIDVRDKEIERLNNIINKALEKSKGLQNRYGYVLDDLTYLLMQGSDKNDS